ncbi:MAG: hypothetical protein J7K36_02855 [Archaeoglobaceae archaeon]|nr:hypothetical protein [Archaeoglobaceae archaeon]
MNIHKFSLRYLEILEENLKPKKEENKIVLRWQPETPYNLLDDLKYLFKLNKDKIIKSAREISGLKSFHFGPTENPLEVVKYSFLFTDHIIMQDLIYRILFVSQHESNSEIFKRVAPIAIEVLNWKELVENKKLFIVPSPSLWSEEIFKFCASRDEEGPWGEKSTVLNAIIGSNNLDSIPFTDWVKGHRILYKLLEEAVTNMKKDTKIINIAPYLGKRLWYLKDATPQDVFELESKYSGFKAELRHLVSEVLDVQSFQEVEELSKSVAESIEEEIKKMEKERRKIRLKKSVGAIGFITGFVGVVLGVYLGQVITALLAVPTAASLIPLLESSPTHENTVYIAFKYLKEKVKKRK